MGQKSDTELVSNRVAFHNYEIIETLEAGIVLFGTEIKSLREHGGNLQDAYVIFEKGEAFLKGASIAHYRFGNVHNHEEKRTRKLLLHKHESLRFEKLCQTRGYTIVPLSMYLKNGFAKVKIAACRGLKKYDKREAIKKRDVKRSIDAAMKSN